ncbi:MAG: M28 family peptidase [Thermoleophilaceae bacterium]|nr:M28 family peptidase [Thermoleophilaceae bacterium]
MKIDPQQEIAALTAFEGRAPGSDSERRAAEHLADRLGALGRSVEVEPIWIRPSYALTHTIHALLAIAGSVISVSAPLPGALLVLLAGVSTFGDLTGSFHLFRRLVPRRASQNVVSPEEREKPGTLVLVAHYDAARTGAFFNRRAQDRRAAIGKVLRRPIGPWEPVFWSIMLLLLATALRLLGLEGTVLTAIQFIPTVVLIVSVPLLVDIALSGTVQGASDNASGVAAALALADSHGHRLEHFDLWVLLPGAEEGLFGGMREWMRANRRRLDPTSTVFVGIDNIGAGTVRFAEKEGWVIQSRYHPALLELCRELAEEVEDYGARPIAEHTASSVNLARTAGFPAVAISARGALGYSPTWHNSDDTMQRVDPAAVDRAVDFTADLIELIDERIGPDLRNG